MSDEDSLRFWIIPVVSGVAIVLFLAIVGINYLVNTGPMAAQQYEDISKMDCNEIENFPSSTVLYTPQNRNLLTEITDGCAEATKAAKAKQNELLREKLNDPNSVESLLKEFKQQTTLQNQLQKDYDYYSTESELLHQSLLETNEKLSEIKSHSNWSKVLERLNQEEKEE